MVDQEGTTKCKIDNGDNKKMNTINKEPKDSTNKVPFVITLPKDSNKHFPILDSSRSVNMKSGLVTLQPGENVGSHNTGEREELLVILEGIAEVEAEGVAKQNVSVQSVVYIPPGNQHNVKNVGLTQLRYIYTVSPVLLHQELHSDV